ncbi:MAG: hypothetical protein WCI21_00140 [Alphaproteobacteria bacterium]
MKLKLIKALAALGLTVGMTSCVSDGPPPVLADGAQCFRSNDVVAFRQTSETSFVIHTIRHNVFSASLPACNGMDWAQQVALSPIRGSQICEGDEAKLITRSPAGRDMSCSIFSVHQLSAAEAAALPERAQP